MSETDLPDNDQNIDWGRTTWEGARREQMRRWAELPLERAIMALEEMEEVAKEFQRASAGASVAREPQRVFRSCGPVGDHEPRVGLLKAVPLKGFHTGSLGNYLAALGTLRVVSTIAPESGARGSWKSGHFWLWSNLTRFSAGHVCDLISQWKPEPFVRWWSNAQEASKKDDHAVPRARASATDDLVDQLDSVMVQADRRVFSDVFGTGGNVGKRDLASLHKKCSELIGTTADLGENQKRHKKSTDGGKDQSRRAAWLRQALLGEENVELPEIRGAGTWFVFSNKTFNSGQKWFKEGYLSPWSFLLAMEGARLLRGGVHRRLGATTRGKAVFPFLCRPLAAPTAEQIAYRKAEFWAPVWRKPASLQEVVELFRSGVAEVGGRAATAPHEFAVAVLDSAVEAGISTFAPFEMRQTTSSQVFEALPRDLISVRRAGKRTSPSRLLLPLINGHWVDRLPYEPNNPKQRGRFLGLRGPIEASLVRLAANPEDPEMWRSMLSLVARTQQRIDRNKKLRKWCLPVPRLPRDWFEYTWPGPASELLVARAIASIRESPHAEGAAVNLGAPLLANIFGVELGRGGKAFFPESRPTRAVWHDGDLTRGMIDLLRRRLMDVGEADPAPLWGARPCGISEISLFLAGQSAFDDGLVAQWIPALALIEWGKNDDRSRRGAAPPEMAVPPLYSLLRPLFEPSSIRVKGRPLFLSDMSHTNRPHAASLRTMVNLLLQDEIDETVSLARTRYLGFGWRIIDPPRNEMSVDSNRLAASLLVPVAADEVAARFEADWLLPSKERQ